MISLVDRISPRPDMSRLTCDDFQTVDFIGTAAIHALRRFHSAAILLCAYAKCTCCNFQLTRQYLHRPHAFRPHLVAFRRAATPLIIAKLSPESSPCPGVVIHTPNVTTPLQIAGVTCDYGIRTPLLSSLVPGEIMCSRVSPGGLTSHLAHLAQRRPNMQLHL